MGESVRMLLTGRSHRSILFGGGDEALLALVLRLGTNLGAHDGVGEDVTSWHREYVDGRFTQGSNRSTSSKELERGQALSRKVAA